MNGGRVGAYWYYDLGDESLAEVVRTLRDRLVGLCAVNTAFDSGLYQRCAPLPSDWRVVNGHAVSSPLRREDLDSWPLSHDEYCDEWYFFETVPDDFHGEALCNFIGVRIGDWQKLNFEKGIDLRGLLWRYRPRFIIGNNENTYVVSSEQIEWPN